MSISLNDHESRIKALENIRVSDSYLRYPDYNKSTIVKIRANQYNVKEDGWLFVALGTNNQTDVLINGNSISFYNYGSPGNYDDNNGALIPVRTNDYIRTHNGQSVSITIFKLRGGGINFGTLFKKFLVYITQYSKLFHFHLSEVK